jgi:hypothetical protein
MFDTAATIRGIRLAKFRDKLHVALKCQYDLFEKAVQGRTYTLITIERAVTESGRIEELPFYRRLKRWWWKTANGRYAIVIRYGYHRLPFEPGRFVQEADQLAEFMSFLLTQMRRKPTVPADRVREMRAAGHKPGAIAKELGISRMHVYRLTKE